MAAFTSFLPQDLQNMITAISIIIGLINCFFGYRIFRFAFALLGFVVGFLIAASITFSIDQANQKEIASLLAGAIGGLIGAILFAGIYDLAIFAIGALIGYALGEILVNLLNGKALTSFRLLGEVKPSGVEIVLLLILAVVGGIIALRFQELAIVLGTAFGGARVAVAGFFALLGGQLDLDLIRLLTEGPTAVNEFATNQILFFLCWILLGLIGVIVQYRGFSWLKKPASEQKN